MKSTLYALALYALTLCSLTSASRTASVSGNWADISTWGGSAAPVSGDTAGINGNIVVTIPSATSAAVNILYGAATDNSGGNLATLVINGTLTMDSGGYLQTGLGTSKDMKITFVAGGALICTTLWSLNNCVLNSTATRANPFQVTGGNSEVGFVSGARMDIALSNVVFRMTGQMLFEPGDTTGAATPRIILKNCAFIGSNGLTLGSTATPATSTISVTECDFRDFATIKTVTIQRVNGGAATYEFKHNTLSQVIAPVDFLSLTPKVSSGLLVEGNVFYNGNVATATPNGHTISNNLICAAVAGPIVVDASGSATVTRNYIPSIADNSSGINSSGAPGSGTWDISYNVMDGVVDVTWTGRPDLYLPGATPLASNFHHNLVIGAGEQVIGYSAPNWITLNHKNNTTGVTVSPVVDYGGFLYFSENTVNSTGTINIANNLMRYNGETSGNASISGIEAGGGTPQTVAYSDYNNFFGGLTYYDSDNSHLVITAGNTAKTVPGSHDISKNPQFVDTTRNLGTWNLHFGSGTTSYDDALTYLLGINGYRGSPNFDQNGTISTRTPGELLDWVRAGFAPTNLLLRGAGDPGDGSPDIGAVSVVSKTTFMFF